MKAKKAPEERTPEEGFALTILAGKPYKKSIANLRGKALVREAMKSADFDRVFGKPPKKRS